MSYIALYRKWRPSVFEDVVEQEHVVKTLKYSVVTGRIAHAYLFCGTRGTGKTTMAKIFSRAINCLNPHDGDPCNECEICKGILSDSILDVIEIDAASNNSVDNVREIRDEVIYAPSQAKYKVYIIDEVHMLSTGAFNALLKTLEEPPSHVVFILATTDPHKLPATILSRCQRFDFRRISIESIVSRLYKISENNGISLQSNAARLIAKMSDGALRDAISILDQCISMGNKEIAYNDVLSVVGIVNDTFISSIIDAVNFKDINRVLELIDSLIIEGKDISQFFSDLIHYYRNLLICKVSDRPEDIIDLSAETLERMKTQAVDLDRDEIMQIIKELSSVESGLKWASHPRVMLEVALIKLCENNYNFNNANILERISALEKKIASGNFQTVVAPVASKPIAYEEQKAEEKKAVSKPAPETKKPSASGGQKSIEYWGEILNELKGGGRMALYSSLLGVKAIEIDDKIVGIIFSSKESFNKLLVSKAENLEVLGAITSKKLGREVRVKCLDEEEFTGSTQEEEKDEFLDKAKELAQRFDVPLNIIDE